jgi:hypothetical protein
MAPSSIPTAIPRTFSGGIIAEVAAYSGGVINDDAV